jgi:CheY-like chemotaxis protein
MIKSPFTQVLIVDDDNDDRDILQDCLLDVLPDAVVTHADDGATCLRLLKNGFTPDIIFMDLNMPLTNGLECLEQMQREQLATDTPVIVSSTSQHLKDINSAHEFGARFYLVKPSSLQQMRTLLKRVLYLFGQPLAEQTLKKNFVLGGRGW